MDEKNTREMPTLTLEPFADQPQAAAAQAAPVNEKKVEPVEMESTL